MIKCLMKSFYKLINATDSKVQIIEDLTKPRVKIPKMNSGLTMFWQYICCFDVWMFFDVFLRSTILLKKRLWSRGFPTNFAKFLRTPFFRTPLGDYFWHVESFAHWPKNFLKKFNLFFRQKRRSGKPIRKNWTQKQVFH